jgi:2-keto-4-pentenoate hydratase
MVAQGPLPISANSDYIGYRYYRKCALEPVMSFDPAPAARLLTDATNSRTQFKELPEANRPGSLDQGYDIQDRMARDAGTPGGLMDTVAGWKLGLGSANAMKGANLTRPVIGRVLKGRLYKDGDTIRVPAHLKALVEIEIAFTLGRDVTPADTFSNPLDAVADTHIACELVLSRYIDRTKVGLPSFVADSVGFHALVVGQKLDVKTIETVARTAVVHVDGKETAGCQTGGDTIDAIWSLGQLMAHARERGLILRKGEIVTTGTITKPFDAPAPSSLVVTATVHRTVW